MDMINSVLGINKFQRFNRARKNRWHPVLRAIVPFFESIAHYHQYSVVGIEHIPKKGRCILAVSHSFATYDAFLLGMAIKHNTGRLPVGLGDNLLFNLPGVSTAAAFFNLYRANPRNGKRLLAEECLLGIAPGGMKEALRSSLQKRTVCWSRRKGFIRMAIQTQSPIILAACPAADDIYDVYEHWFTDWVYKRYKVPLPIFRGRSKMLLPKPIKLTHYLSKPLLPPVPPIAQQPQKCSELVDDFHQQVVAEMNTLIQQD